MRGIHVYSIIRLFACTGLRTPTAAGQSGANIYMARGYLAAPGGRSSTEIPFPGSIAASRHHSLNTDTYHCINQDTQIEQFAIARQQVCLLPMQLADAGCATPASLMCALVPHCGL